MVENRKLLIALAVVLLLGVAARFTLTGTSLENDVYYTSVPDETPSFQALEMYVCPQCLEEIYEARKDFAENENAEKVLERLRLYYDQPAENGRCPNHADQELVKTADLPVAPGVKITLPPGTEFISRLYARKNAPREDPFSRIEFNIVISSKDKRSIHRPESCMASQGWTLRTQGTLSLECDRVPGGTLHVRRLIMEKPVRDQLDRPLLLQTVVFYWYAALPDRLTASEYKRLAIMFTDRLVRGTNYRWSYVLISQLVPLNAGDAEAVSNEVEQFIKEFTDIVEIKGGSE